MEKVTDPYGVDWTVRRLWWKPVPGETGFATLDMIIFTIMLPFMLAWPFWLAAKWFGVPWTILIHRDGTEVGREQVRGGRKAKARVKELAQFAAAGALPYTPAPTETPGPGVV